MVPPIVMFAFVTSGPTRIAVDPLAEFRIVMLEPASRSTELLLLTRTATPLASVSVPPEANRMLSAEPLLAFDV
jgi:hypothetical protein